MISVSSSSVNSVLRMALVSQISMLYKSNVTPINSKWAKKLKSHNYTFRINLIARL